MLFIVNERSKAEQGDLRSSDSALIGGIELDLLKAPDEKTLEIEDENITKGFKVAEE
jgi:hypothetical protein